MGLVPAPGVGDDLFESRISRLPAQFAHCFFGRGHQFGSVPGSPWFFDGWYGPSDNLFTSINHLSHGIAVPIAEVVEALPARLQGENVGLRQINDMNVIANAGAVGRRIIDPKNLAVFGAAQRHLKNVGDEMGFDAMMLAKFLAGAGGV